MISVLNSIDYFASIPSKLSYRTIFGGMMSLSSCLIAIFLLLNSWDSYFDERSKSEVLFENV